MVRTPGTGDTTKSIQPAFQDMSPKEPSNSKAKAKAKSDLKASSKKHAPKPKAERSPKPSAYAQQQVGKKNDLCY